MAVKKRSALTQIARDAASEVLQTFPRIQHLLRISYVLGNPLNGTKYRVFNSQINTALFGDIHNLF